MNKTDIEWCDMTWNPVTGCLHGCKYCYARKQANRFKGFEPRCGGEEIPDGEGTCVGSIHNTTHGETLHIFNKQPMRRFSAHGYPNGKFVKASYPYNFDPTFHRYRLGEPQEVKTPQTVFVGSMCDLFGTWVPNGWINEVLKACASAPQHRYLFLTKNYRAYAAWFFEEYGGTTGRIHRKKPINGVEMHFGMSVTNNDQLRKAAYSYNGSHWLSLEPLHEEIDTDIIYKPGNYPRWKWIVIGAETGNRKGKIIPQADWINKIVKVCKEASVPIFMKNSLIPIVGEDDMLREYPWEVTI